MQIKCPSCNAQFPLEAAIAFDAARSALNTALQMPAPLAAAIAQYLGMFRPSGRALAFDRADRLMSELLPMLKAERVERNGNARACPLSIWQAAIERMLEQRSRGALELPLKSHGYLLEIAFGLADKAEAAAERATEASRRNPASRTQQAPTQASELLARNDRFHRLIADVRLGLLTVEDATDRLRADGFDVHPDTFK